LIKRSGCAAKIAVDYVSETMADSNFIFPTSFDTKLLFLAIHSQVSARVDMIRLRHAKYSI